MSLAEALEIVKAAGYRVTKVKEKKGVVSQVGPTCVAKFADGEVCRMSTWAGRMPLDWDRGVANCIAAYESRKRTKCYENRGLNPTVPPIVELHFERDGVVLATRAVA